MKIIGILFFLVSSFSGLNSYSQYNDSLTSSQLNKKRLILASTATGSIWSGSILYLSTVWYDEFEKVKFHSFDDSKEWLQMDKIGHYYSSYHISEANYRIYKWTGLSEKTSTWIGAGIGFGFQTSLEILDGRNSDWGFSWYDMAANALGSASFVAQQLIWSEQRLLMKFSYHPTEYAAYRPQVLGSSFSESLLKDYNGQTYWLSFSPRQFTDNWKLPAWLCFSVGYSIEEKLIGDKNIYVTEDQVFQARRQYLFSLDLDVRELPIQKKWIKSLLRPLHFIKIPFPTLIIDGNQLTGSWLYF